MLTKELHQALKEVLGVFAGRGGPNQLHTTWKGAGLKIWGSWHIHNHVTERPLFAGQASLKMARLLYHIADPTVAQMSLF
jgi:hypothetical protein